MTTEDLCSLPVGELAEKDCILFQWTTFPKLEDSLAVIKAWGFQYKTNAFTWVKQNPSGIGWKFGLGYWTRSCSEICLLATRGHPKRVSNKVHQLIEKPVGRHSAKPLVTKDKIVELMGDLSRIELFAREVTPGWTAIGDEITGRDIRHDLNLLIHGFTVGLCEPVPNVQALSFNSHDPRSSDPRLPQMPIVRPAAPDDTPFDDPEAGVAPTGPDPHL